MKSLAEIIKETAHFKYYRKENLVYKTDSGFEFSIPTSDTNDATFPATEKAIFFMRWIRKQYSQIAEETVVPS